MAKTIIASNQEYIDQVIKENERLVQMCSEIKPQIEKAKTILSKTKEDVLRSIEPQIQKLLQEQKIELEKQKNELEHQIEREQIQIQSEKEKQKLINLTSLAKQEEECKLKILKMQNSAASREKELKSAIEAKLARIPAKLEDARKSAEAEEEIIRQQWEKMIIEKFKNDYESNLEQDAKSEKDKQEHKIMEVIGQLEVEARESQQKIELKIENENKQHQAFVKRMNLKILDLNEELDNLKSSNDCDQEIEELKKVLANCQCSTYRRSIQSINKQIESIENQIYDQKQRQNERKNSLARKNTQLMNQVQLKEEENRNLKIQLEGLNKRIEQSKENLSKAINEMEIQQKQQLAIITNRVKQTIEKKDTAIKQLQSKLESIGISIKNM